jgi:hypothetical protein
MTKDDFVMELSKLRPSSTFLALHKYRNRYGEIADFSIVFHMSYQSALRRSLGILEKIKPQSDLEKIAKEQLIRSYSTSLSTTSSPEVPETDGVYQRFFDERGRHIKGVKMHLRTGELHLYGLIVHKKIIMPTEYPKVNHAPLTLAKNEFRKHCPVENFRQFKILPNHVDRIAVQSKTLLPPR